MYSPRLESTLPSQRVRSHFQNSLRVSSLFFRRKVLNSQANNNKDDQDVREQELFQLQL